jgi:hypothetical protein
VYDYKGGELTSSTNLDEEEFYAELSELFENAFDEGIEGMTVNQIESKVNETINDDEFFSTYASGDGFCGEIYEHINNELIKVSIKKFIPQIAEQIKKNWE